MRRKALVKQLEEELELSKVEDYFRVMHKALLLPQGGWLIVRPKGNRQSPHGQTERIKQCFENAVKLLAKQHRVEFLGLQFHIQEQSRSRSGNYCIKITNDNVSGWIASEYIPGDSMTRARIDWERF